MPLMPATNAPRWDLDSHPRYQQFMAARCPAIIARLKANGAERQQFYADPRLIHRELHTGLTPVNYTDYAGTYRGEPRSSVEQTKAFSPSDFPGRPRYELMVPGRVNAAMTAFSQNCPTLIAAVIGKPHDEKIAALAMIFSDFGYIHPFVDGNGHIQRMMFECLAVDLGITLGTHWHVHPRPYGALLGVALELDVTTPNHAALPLIAEYLNLFTI